MLAAIAAICCIAPAMAQPDPQRQAPQIFDRPLVIAHRGASGERPEHTLAAYELAIDQGADFIEPDLVATRDGVLVARHENEISGTTDIDQRPEFASRLTTRMIDGEEITGWFTEDFTLAELRSLRARERLPHLRPENTEYDGQFLIPTFAEIIALVQEKEAQTGRRIGLYPEIKHPTYFASIGHDLARMLLSQLHDAGYRNAQDPVFIQCFEVTPLVRLNTLTDLRLVQLIESSGGPADIAARTYAQMIAPDGLARIATYADAIGPDWQLVLQEDGAPTPLVRDAHENGLLVHPWTLRRENDFMPKALKSNDNPRGLGGLPPLMGLLVSAGVDGIFTDHPGAAVMLRESGDYAP